MRDPVGTGVGATGGAVTGAAIAGGGRPGGSGGRSGHRRRRRRAGRQGRLPRGSTRIEEDATGATTTRSVRTRRTARTTSPPPISNGRPGQPAPMPGASSRGGRRPPACRPEQAKGKSKALSDAKNATKDAWKPRRRSDRERQLPAREPHHPAPMPRTGARRLRPGLPLRLGQHPRRPQVRRRREIRSPARLGAGQGQVRSGLERRQARRQEQLAPRRARPPGDADGDGY